MSGGNPGYPSICQPNRARVESNRAASLTLQRCTYPANLQIMTKNRAAAPIRSADEPEVLPTRDEYLPRRLSGSIDEATSEPVDEDRLIRISGGVVVLGEPGMGKSELMRELGRRTGTRPVSAIRFVNHKNPAKLVTPNAPLLIDALDEAMARRDGDAIDAVLAQLEAAGSPDFVLSCRAREWQARGASNLAESYGSEPKILSIEPFHWLEAQAFLAAGHPTIDPVRVLRHLEAHGLEDLYGNPLTLGLMGRVAENDDELPASRATLFERVCELLWPEHDANRQDGGLAQLTQDQALSATGAICAALILAGSETASIAGAAQIDHGDLRIPEIEALPGAEHARAVFGSKLFQSVGISRAKPIHRVVAEFLGARWLAAQAKTPRSGRRLLQQFHGGGAVPASLRGLHAWLAYHAPGLAEPVIAADPYGMLRYGETTALSPSQAACLFRALEALAGDDPYFRASDWDARTATGLMIPELADRVSAVIGSTDSNPHLRSLLVETLQGSRLADALAEDLDVILLSPHRFYRERDAAAKALRAHRDISWWRKAIETLAREGGEDAPRLMRGMMRTIDYAVPEALIVHAIFAESGFLSSLVPRPAKPRMHTIRNYTGVLTHLGAERIGPFVDVMADYAAMAFGDDWRNANDMADLSSRAIVKAIDLGVVTETDGERLWRWLGIVEKARRYHRAPKDELDARLGEQHGLRRAVQAHALYAARRKDTIWAAEHDLQHRSVGLCTHDGDALHFLEAMTGRDNRDETLRAEWEDLARIAGQRDGMPAARAAAAGFMAGDRRLAAFLDRLETSKAPGWLLRSQREDAKRNRKERIQLEIERRYYRRNRDGLRAGDLQQIVDPAQEYLGLFPQTTSDSDGLSRLQRWLGDDFVADVQAGFAAALLREDLPTIAEIGESFAEGRIYNYAYVIVAGLHDWHASRDLAELPLEILTKGLMFLDHYEGWGSDVDFAPLRARLEALVLPTEAARESFARAISEPALDAGREHVSGLYRLGHDEGWLAVGAKLAAEWLIAYPDLSAIVEPELIDCVLHGGETARLAQIARARAATTQRDHDHMLLWLAVDVIVRFDEVENLLTGIGAQVPNFLFFLRNRAHHERRDQVAPLRPAQTAWIVAEFRAVWPYVSLSGGNSTPYNASDYLRGLIDRLANDGSFEAAAAMTALRDGPEDSYSDYIRHMAAEQRQKRAEANFSPLLPVDLSALLGDGPPSNAEDLKALVLEELAVAQKVLVGDDLDQVRDFWDPRGKPFDENRCRDRLAALIGPELARYGVQRITEADMPASKRADLAFASGALQLPMEVKGQWHKDVWDAASGQLDAQYLLDWRSEERGIYCVLWFGDLPAKSQRRLKPPPNAEAVPVSAAAMQLALVSGIPEARRPLIDVVVLDLSGGHRFAEAPASQQLLTDPGSVD